MASYICVKIWKGFGLKPAIIWAVLSVLIVTWWSLFRRVLEINIPPVLSLIGYMYLPVTGFAFVLFLAVDLIRLVLWCLLRIKVNAKHELLLVFTLVAAMLCYGYFEAKDVRTVEITVSTDKLPRDIDTIKIVQITDLHIGKTFDVMQLNKAMEITLAAKPDLIVLTGDMVDMDLRGDVHLAKTLGSVDAPLGKYAVTGNHEHYAGFNQSIDFKRRAGYIVLQSEWYDLGPIVIAGVDDPGRAIVSKRDESFNLLSSLPDDLRNKFILFLKHQPHVHEDNISLFDLQISGHTHGGQIWPFKYIVSLVHGVKQGLSAYGDSLLYVSNGTGNWGPPVRFLAPPEVTVINVTRK